MTSRDLSSFAVKTGSSVILFAVLLVAVGALEALTLPIRALLDGARAALVTFGVPPWLVPVFVGACFVLVAINAAVEAGADVWSFVGDSAARPWSIAVGVERSRERTEEDVDELTAAKRAYARGEIGEVELEQRLEAALAEQADGSRSVGPRDVREDRTTMAALGALSEGESSRSEREMSAAEVMDEAFEDSGDMFSSSGSASSEGVTES